MTQNQIAYWALQETKRSNLAREKETARSNLANETETKRSNLAREHETYRSNVARENETARHNLATENISLKSLSEAIRHNKATELELNRSNLVREAETQRHNVAAEKETSFHNRNAEAIEDTSVRLKRVTDFEKNEIEKQKHGLSIASKVGDWVSSAINLGLKTKAS